MGSVRIEAMGPPSATEYHNHNKRNKRNKQITGTAPSIIQFRLSAVPALVYLMGHPSPEDLDSALHMTTRRREAEIALGARSRHRAEAELKLVDSARFAKAITEFI